jgi:alpha-D-xyloside xylohydrolase
MLYENDNSLRFRWDAEQLQIEPWGTNAFRVRATKSNTFPSEDWALEKLKPPATAKISISEREATIENGKIKATISQLGKLMVFNSKGELLLEEYARNRRDLMDPKCSSIEVEAREFKPIPGGDYHLTMRFESVSAKEKIYGMGQYQQDSLDLKGHDLELAHRNSQASVPFAISSLGYGFLWNNPSIGRAVLGKNIMSFEAYSTRCLDYWVVAGDSPSEIEEAYARVTGTVSNSGLCKERPSLTICKVPMMPEYGLGFWQCKLRYQTQEELLSIAREYRARKLPIDLIVIDFFHWPKQGEWKFDPTYWPNPGKSPLN